MSVTAAQAIGGHDCNHGVAAQVDSGTATHPVDRLIPRRAKRDPWYQPFSARRRLPTRRAYRNSEIVEESRSPGFGISVPLTHPQLGKFESTALTGITSIATTKHLNSLISRGITPGSDVPLVENNPDKRIGALQTAILHTNDTAARVWPPRYIPPVQAVAQSTTGIPFAVSFPLPTSAAQIPSHAAAQRLRPPRFLRWPSSDPLTDAAHTA